MTDPDDLVPHVSIPTLADLTGATPRRLDWWIATGHLRCTEPFPGSGNPRTIPATETPIVALVVALTADGVTPAAAFPLARTLHATGTATLAGCTLTRRSP